MTEPVRGWDKRAQAVLLAGEVSPWWGVNNERRAMAAIEVRLQAAFDAGAAQERERCAEWVQSMVDAALRAAPPTPNP